jgi:glyoxylase-like metal-dependent hydrolase (beta-lactamase superfamily II)/rhodanese-related sulfurtransferase
MLIHQTNDKGLAHYGYAILDETSKQVILIDPARNPEDYLDFAAGHGATITHIIETHPHADFVSSHAEIARKTGASIHVSKLLGAMYAHETFDDGDVLTFSEFTLEALNTPGHSPDSITILMNVDGVPHAAFTGDTLFIGDVGRPDLREAAGNITAKRADLARDMYRSTRQKLMTLPDHVLVYPAHGSGSLCGKALSDANVSTIGNEKLMNPALKSMTEDEFVEYLTADQPFIPKYFPYVVDLNRRGAPDYVILAEGFSPRKSKSILVDARPSASYVKGHLPGAINIQDGGKFETWLGSIVGPEERWTLVLADAAMAPYLIAKAAKIGYELRLDGVLIYNEETKTLPDVDVNHFRANPSEYTIVDVRNRSEIRDKQVFSGAMAIPLPELREHVRDIPTDKPILVHCAAGYRSAAGSSIIREALPGAVVYDLGERITTF